MVNWQLALTSNNLPNVSKYQIKNDSLYRLEEAQLVRVYLSKRNWINSEPGGVCQGEKTRNDLAIMQAQPRGSDRQCGRFTQRHSFLYIQLVIFKLTGTTCCEPYQFPDGDKVHWRLATNVE